MVNKTRKHVCYRFDVNFSRFKENDGFIDKLKCYRQQLSFPGRLLVSTCSVTASFSVSMWRGYTKTAYVCGSWHSENIWKQHINVARTYKSYSRNHQAVCADFGGGKNTFSYSLFWTTHHSWEGGHLWPVHSLFIHALTSGFLLHARSTFKGDQLALMKAPHGAETLTKKW